MEEKLETLTIKDYVDIYNLLVGVLLCFSDDYVLYEILFQPNTRWEFEGQFLRLCRFKSISEPVATAYITNLVFNMNL